MRPRVYFMLTTLGPASTLPSLVALMPLFARPYNETVIPRRTWLIPLRR